MAGGLLQQFSVSEATLLQAGGPQHQKVVMKSSIMDEDEFASPPFEDSDKEQWHWETYLELHKGAHNCGFNRPRR